MKTRNVVTREQWLAERRELLQQEKKFTRARDALTKARQELPWVKIEKDYQFDSEDGIITLGDLFSIHSQLIIYHFMYGPDWKQGCSSCSYWADNFNGIEPHLNARDIAFAVVSSAPVKKLLAFRKRLGWNFDWVSSGNSSFNQDFGVSFGPDHKPDDLVTYNYRETQFPAEEAPGISVFVKAEEGTIYHSYSTYSRGLDMLNGAYNFMDLTPKGRDEKGKGNPMFWLRLNDSYS
ncbi:DUF899 domain-containing protein [Kiloniella laminariae]|uniref:DUF899 domain-containing protein n=1 Tax=Kiloniella laminariae TaxID=454162 RepID=A0ABT4LP75_9PROT|nr:DUF899 domain-containing protein [Kiloniella laminariae]MCZ4282884.1 DUF899 domain-containing protein [Kiloniella laminariae]